MAYTKGMDIINNQDILQYRDGYNKLFKISYSDLFTISGGSLLTIEYICSLPYVEAAIRLVPYRPS